MMDSISLSPVLSPSSDRAFVLIIILWITVGLVSIALLFGQSMMLEYRASTNSLAGLQAEQAIDGGLRYAIYVLVNAEEPGMLPDEDTYETDWAELDDSAFWFIGRDPLNTPTTTPAFGLVDECSKLNLNTATVEMLELLPRMTPELAAAIVDWRDEDDDVTTNGAESSTYLLLNPSYACKNAPFETVDELHLVYGADWDILHGEDANSNGVLDPNENDGSESYPDDNRDGKLDPGILEYLTVYSVDPSQVGETTKINITGDDAQTSLTTLLQETFSDDRATEIMSKVSSTLTTLTSVLEFYIRSEMTPEEFAEIDEQLSISDEDTEGLININTAPEEVLACIPGIGTANASSVVSYRRSNSGNLDSVAWLSKALDEANAIEAGPYITAQTYQYTADIAAVGHGGNGYHRVQFVIDASGDEPVVRYRRDMTRYGWALGREIRNELAYLKESQK